MKKTTRASYLLLVAMLAGGAHVAFAQPAQNAQGPNQKIREERKIEIEKLQQQREAARQEMKEKADEFRKEAQQKKEEFLQQIKSEKPDPAVFEAKKEEFIKAQSTAREAFRTEVQNARDTASQKVTEAKDALKKKIADMKDEAKKKVALSVSQRLSDTQTKVVNTFTLHIQKLDALFSQISTRAAELKAKGIDVSAVAKNLDAAQQSLEQGKDMVKAISGKVYMSSATSSADVDVKGVFAAALTALKTDVGNARKSFEASRQSLQDAFKELRLVEKNTATPSPEAAAQSAQ